MTYFNNNIIFFSFHKYFVKLTYLIILHEYLIAEIQVDILVLYF